MISTTTAPDDRWPRRAVVALLALSLAVTLLGTWVSWRDVGRPFGR